MDNIMQTVIAHKCLTTGEEQFYTSKFLGYNKDLANILLSSQKRVDVKKDSRLQITEEVSDISIPGYYKPLHNTETDMIESYDGSTGFMSMDGFVDLCSQVQKIKGASAEETIQKLQQKALSNGDIMKFMNRLQYMNVSNIEQLYELIDKNYTCTNTQHEKLIRQLNFWLHHAVGTLIHDDDNSDELKHSFEEIMFITSGDFFKGLENEDIKIRKLRESNPIAYITHYANRLKNEFPDKYETLCLKYNHDYNDIILKALDTYQNYEKQYKIQGLYKKALDKFATEVSCFFEYVLSKRRSNAKYSEYTLDKLFYGSQIGDLAGIYSRNIQAMN